MSNNILEVVIVHNNPDIEKEFDKNKFNIPIFIKYLDINSLKTRKEAFNLKSYWGARKDPFVIVYDKDKPVKVLYSEVEDVIKELTNYLKTL